MDIGFLIVRHLEMVDNASRRSFRIFVQTQHHITCIPTPDGWSVLEGGGHMRKHHANTQHTLFSLSLSRFRWWTGGVVVLLVTLKLALFSIDPARAPVSSYRQKDKHGISHLLSPPLSPPASTSANIIYPTRATPPRHCIFIRPRAEIPPPPVRPPPQARARTHARSDGGGRRLRARSLPNHSPGASNERRRGGAAPWEGVSRPDNY
jgi:hypothetical protein